MDEPEVEFDPTAHVAYLRDRFISAVLARPGKQPNAETVRAFVRQTVRSSLECRKCEQQVADDLGDVLDLLRRGRLAALAVLRGVKVAGTTVDLDDWSFAHVECPRPIRHDGGDHRKAERIAYREGALHRRGG